MVGTGHVYKASLPFVAIIYGQKSGLSGRHGQAPIALYIDSLELTGDGLPLLGPGQPGKRDDPVTELGQFVVG